MADELTPLQHKSLERIAAVLRKWRDEAGLNQKDAADKAGHGYSQSMLSRLEHAEREITSRHIRDLGQVYGVDEQEIDELVRQLERPDGDSILVTHGDTVPGFASDYFADEQRASELDVYHGKYVFGLHQVASYVRSSRAEVDPDLTAADLDRSEALRLDRQKCLARDNPLRLNVIYDEDVLRRNIGGAGVMREQIDRLIEESYRHRIEIVRLSAGAYPSMGQDFTIVRFDALPGKNYAYTEHGQSATYHIRARRAFYEKRFVQIRKRALSPDKSRDLLVTLRNDLWKQ